MTHIRTPRFWLLTTAALIFSSATAASAQDYQMGTPTMVAAAPGLPSIPAEQIARDVTSEFNPRTGTRELAAAPFDPFEEDPTLAGSLRLRSADGAIAMNGQPLRDGALVELDFYYNSPSDDPYGGRNYGDVAFVNGELAPTVLRDSRILECSTRVENVVYDHASYYDRGYAPGIYRPYRHYAGHSGFGFGFGNSYYGPGYGYYDSRRSFGHRSRRGDRARRPSTHRRVLDAVRNRDGADRRRDRRETNGVRADGRRGSSEPARTNSRRLTDRQIEERLNRVQSYGVGRSRAGVRRNARGTGPSFEGVEQQPRIGVAPTRSSTTTSRSVEPRRSSRRRGETRRAEPRRSETRQAQPRRDNVQRSNVTRAEPRRSETRRSEPRRQTNTRSNSRPKNVKKEAPRRRISGGETKRRMKNFFPNDGFGSRGVVSSRSVDCAREDKLRVFIPNERLDAARFDGLTLIAFDAQGGEAPIYLPPNYIEGFRMAASGQIRPQGFQSAPQAPTPQYTPPRARLESAPCPSGTTKQGDGTCLQTGTIGYPAR